MPLKTVGPVPSGGITKSFCDPAATEDRLRAGEDPPTFPSPSLAMDSAPGEPGVRDTEARRGRSEAEGAGLVLTWRGGLGVGEVEEAAWASEPKPTEAADATPV